MTPEEIVEKFAHALNNFNLIVGQPFDSDLTRLREAVAPLLLQILYDKNGRGPQFNEPYSAGGRIRRALRRSVPQTHKSRGLQKIHRRGRYGRRLHAH